MYVCVCMCMYVYICIYVVCMSMHLYVCIYVCLNVCMSMCIVDVYTCAYTKSWMSYSSELIHQINLIDQGCVDVDTMIEQYDKYLSDLLNKHAPKKNIYVVDRPLNE